jgi:hypothetical protein
MSTIVPADARAARTERAFVIAVWAIATAVNLGKAAHIDDGAHLEIASHILRDPLHPMRGTVFWGAHPEPIHALNQPHLVYYVIALGLLLGGGSLVVPQLLLSLFVLPGVAAMHALARQLFVGERARERAMLATTLVFLGPGFLPGQNLMTDAPLVSLVCVALWALATGEGRRDRLALAGVALGLACLTKYTALALLPLFVIDAWRVKDLRRAWPLAIPLAMLGLYALFNLYDYGGVHVLERHPGGVGDFGPLARVGITFARLALFVLTLGAIAFAPLVTPPSRRVASALGLAFALLVVGTRVVAAVGPMEMRDEPWAVTLLRTAFFLSGVVLAVRVSRSVELGDRSDVLLASAAVLLTVFVVVLSPFVAVRHALLVLPSVTLLVLRRQEVPTRRALALGVASLVLGLIVAAGDRAQASVYREAGQRYREPSATPGRTWFVGHWGWQWYAEDAAMRPYDPGVSVLAPGDRVIAPRLVDQQPIDEADRACLERETDDQVAAGLAAIARTITSRQGYYAVWQGLPYGPSDEPLETFTLYRVTCFARSAAQ